MIKNRNIAPDAWIDPSKVAGSGVGEIFYVCKNSSAGDTLNYGWLHGRVPSDNLFTTIQAALDATQECRNDYVLVWPSDSDYDLTAALTMSKKGVHLIGVGGFGYERGATNSVRVEQTTAATAIIEVSDANIEIAGFYFKPYIGCNHITLAATSYAPNIHHNTFVLKWTTSNSAAIQCAGDGGAWGQVSHHNWFISQAGDDQTCAVIVSIGASATGARCDYNDFMIGDGNTATSCITNSATKGTANYNNFQLAQADGTITHAITVGTWGSAIGNRACVGDGAIMTGGAVDASFVDNMNAADGGTQDDAD